ncbi:MAG: hypothetical protein KF773_27670 [Deltaproteobacteria bacterium]|nr:hypothetical protein [Deltaproteobacteria bacterium]MCW5803898.1 hypothetical protein [Deltaproteobacteria bacterium]
MRGFIAIAAALLIACGPPSRDGNLGGGDDDDDGNGGPGGDGQCPAGAELVYVIDQFSHRISQFDPSTKTFVDLGQLPCQPRAGATPFSMSVDRTGTAWVLYSSGELFHVGLQGLGCTPTAWASPNNMLVFGMGFSTDAVGGGAESLFIGGGRSQTQASYTLARVDPATMATTTIGQEPELPEMTGNSNAELWGFFPSATTPRVVQFDKTNGTFVKEFPLPQLAGTMTGYAFAHWGGDYWVFLLKNGESSTTVYQVNGQTGAITSTTPAPGRTIVGAGVSTCAPVVIM